MHSDFDPATELPEEDTYVGTLRAEVMVSLDVTDQPVHSLHDLADLLMQVDDAPLDTEVELALPPK